MIKFKKNDPEAKIFYDEHGYVVIQSLVHPEILEKIRDQILDIFETGFGVSDGGFNLLRDAYSDERKEIWKFFAKRMAYVPALLTATGADSVCATLRLLGLEKPIISTHPEVRTDMPRDIQYQQPWHQDWRYGQSSMNSVTIWTPLHDMCSELGPVSLLPGTHKEGLYPYKERLAPRAFVIDLESVELPLEKMVQANILFGESIIFSQMLVHGSMNNISNSPRLSFQMRYADLCDEAFRKNFYKTPVGSELVWKEEPLKKM